MASIQIGTTVPLAKTAFLTSPTVETLLSISNLNSNVVVNIFFSTSLAQLFYLLFLKCSHFSSHQMLLKEFYTLPQSCWQCSFFILTYLPQTPQPIVVAYYVIMVMIFGTFCTFYAAFIFFIISISDVLHKPVTKWNFKLYNVIDAISFVILLVALCAGNAYCWQKTDSK